MAFAFPPCLGWLAMEFLLVLLHSALRYAHAPTRLMAKAPKKTSREAKTRFLPRSSFQLLSLRKSSESSSTRDANVRRPAEMAFMVPTTRRPVSEFGLYSEWVARPMAWPMGVLMGLMMC